MAAIRRLRHGVNWGGLDPSAEAIGGATVKLRTAPFQPGESEAARLRALFDSLDEAVVAFDDEGRLRFANRPARTMFGFASPDLHGAVEVGSDRYRLASLDGEDLATEASPLRRAARGETFDDLRLQTLDTVSGRRGLRSYRAAALAAGVVGERLLLLTARDLAPGDSATEGAPPARVERTFGSAFRRAPLPALMVRRDDDLLLDVNDTFLRELRLERAAVAGRRLPELAIWESAQEAARLRAALDEGGRYRGLDLALRVGEGQRLQVLAWGERLDLDGLAVDLHMFCDVTARTRAEELLRRELAEALSDATWFARSMVERMAHLRGGDPVEDGGVRELTRREREVLAHMAAGRSNDDIAAALGIAEQTVRNYISNIYTKIGVHTRAEAVVWARERGLAGWP